MPVIGFLSGRSPREAAIALDAYRQGLADVGYIEGKNSRSNTDGLKAGMTDCRRLRLN